LLDKIQLRNGLDLHQKCSFFDYEVEQIAQELIDDVRRLDVDQIHAAMLDDRLRRHRSFNAFGAVLNAVYLNSRAQVIVCDVDAAELRMVAEKYDGIFINKGSIGPLCANKSHGVVVNLGNMWSTGNSNNIVINCGEFLAPLPNSHGTTINLGTCYPQDYGWIMYGRTQCNEGTPICFGNRGYPGHIVPAPRELDPYLEEFLGYCKHNTREIPRRYGENPAARVKKEITDIIRTKYKSEVSTWTK
jgi:hypothetical protein